MGELSEHGISLPPNMQGLTEEQIEDLKLIDEWEDKCVPSGGAIEKKDPIGRRNGQGLYACMHCREDQGRPEPLRCPRQNLLLPPPPR